MILIGQRCVTVDEPGDVALGEGRMSARDLLQHPGRPLHCAVEIARLASVALRLAMRDDDAVKGAALGWADIGIGFDIEPTLFVTAMVEAGLMTTRLQEFIGVLGPSLAPFLGF